jgi:hypothetical protein
MISVASSSPPEEQEVKAVIIKAKSTVNTVILIFMEKLLVFWHKIDITGAGFFVS